MVVRIGFKSSTFNKDSWIFQNPKSKTVVLLYIYDNALNSHIMYQTSYYKGASVQDWG